MSAFRRARIKVLTPPAEVAASDPPVEGETGKHVAPDVVWSGGRDHASGSKDDGPDDESGKASGVATGNDVLDDGAQEANEPEPVDPREHGTSTKDTTGTNNTPDDTGVVEGSCVVASQSLLLVRRAEILDVAGDKVEGGNLDNGQPDDSKSLGSEHTAGRDLDVVANFHVGNVRQAIGVDHVAPRLEQHHGNRAAGKHVTDNHLSDDVETGLVVGDSDNDADGDEKDDTNNDAQHISPARQMGRETKRGTKAHGETTGKDDEEPPLGSFLVSAHKLQMNIRLLRSAVTSATDNIRAVEEHNVHNSGDEGSKTQAVRKREARSNDDGRVFLVGGLVDGVFRGQDPGDVVWLGVSVVVLVGSQR